jgi:4-amino-4-deoxy-L-arabinose transferase-like glycosyltransferase
MAKRPNTAPKATQRESAPFFERYARPLLAAVLLLALGLRIAALANLSHSIYVDFLLWDERIYHEIALRIANGTYESKEVYEFAPLFAYLMAGVYRLFFPEILLIRLLNILFGVLVCWSVYGIGTRLGGARIGLLACLTAAFYQPLIFYSIVPLKDILAVLLFALTTLLLMDAVEKKRGLLPAGLAGLALGLLINVRPNAIVLMPVLLLVILWRRYRNGVPIRGVAAVSCLFLLGFFLAVSPFMLRNYLVAGQFALTTSQSGFNLYLGNNLKNPDPYYRPVPFATSSPSEQGIQFTIEASRRTGRVLNSREASDYWTREVFRMALAEPRAFAAKLFRKALVLINRFEACDHYDIGFVGGFVPFFRLPFPGFAVIFPLGMAALALLLFRDRKARVLGLILAVYGATLVIFFTNARYRLPMFAILIPFAALGFADLVATLRRRQFRRAALWGMLLAAFAAVEFLPVRATDDLTAYFNTHAIILDSRGFENEAILYWQRSSQMNRPFSAFANLALAQKEFRKGRTLEGKGYLDRIPDDSFAAAAKQELLGDLLAGEQRIDEASRAYERSLDINSGQRRTLAKLIRIDRIRDPRKAAMDESRLKTIEAFYGKKSGAL